jgi:Protein of unknown function (DUF1064)
LNSLYSHLEVFVLYHDPVFLATLANLKFVGYNERIMKFHNRKVKKYGIEWDSESEAARYEQLRAAQERGEISDLKAHSKDIKFRLLDRTTFKTYSGLIKTQREMTYTPDFTYTYKGALIAEDVKGKITDSFTLKAKLFRARYPHIILRLVRPYKTKAGHVFKELEK